MGGSVKPFCAARAIGSFDDAANRGDLHEAAGDHAVGGDHEILDEFAGAIPFLLYYVDGFVAEEDGADFDGVDVESAIFETQFAEGLRGSILHFDLGL